MKKIIVLFALFSLLSACDNRVAFENTPSPNIEDERSYLVKDLYSGNTFTYGNIMMDAFSDIEVNSLEDETFIMSREELLFDKALIIDDYDMDWFKRANSYFSKEDEDKKGFIWHNLNDEDLEVELEEIINSIKDENVLYWPEVSIRGEMVSFGINYKDSYLYEILHDNEAYIYDGDVTSFYELKGYAYQIKVNDDDYIVLEMISDESKRQTFIYAIAVIDRYNYRCYYMVDDYLDI